MFRPFLILCLAFGGTWLGAWTPEKWFDKAKSPRIASYQIQAALDWEQKTLVGKETIQWRNAGSSPTQEFPLHLYLNAFKGPQSLFYREGGGAGSVPAGNQGDPQSWGYCALKGVSTEGQPLDGHFGEDETVYWVRLPHSVQPGESIRVEIQWEDHFPRVYARSGWGGAFLMGAQWFPKVGVYQGDHWNCHAYHANTEFFSDFGNYEVELSLPNALLLAHTGTQTNFKTQQDITKDPQRPLNVIWKLHAEDVHDFAWALMPSRSWSYKAYEYRGVQVFFYYQPENVFNLERQRFAVQAALKHAAEWYFPYPYPVLTVVDVPKEAAGADGMEYPTLITASSTCFDPWQLRGSLDFPLWPHHVDGGPELLSIHEFGHQYFYGMLASNEVEEPWLDEGFTTWFTRKAMDRIYQAIFASRRFQAGTSGSENIEVIDYWTNPSLDPMAQAGFRMFDFASYFRSTYSKPALVFDQLEAILGRPVMEQVMKAYTQEMAFKHPTGRDFKRIAERVSGRDLSGFWRDFVEGTDVLDMVIHEVKSDEVRQGGWMDSPKGLVFAAPQSVAPGRRGSLTLLRRGGIQVPITLWVRLENRSESRLTWDGQDRWATFEFESPVVAAVLDPDGNYPMLKDRLHGTYTVRPMRRGFHYWSQLITGALTALLQGVGLG